MVSGARQAVPAPAAPPAPLLVAAASWSAQVGAADVKELPAQLSRIIPASRWNHDTRMRRSFQARALQPLRACRWGWSAQDTEVLRTVLRAQLQEDAFREIFQSRLTEKGNMELEDQQKLLVRLCSDLYATRLEELMEKRGDLVDWMTIADKMNAHWRGSREPPGYTAGSCKVHYEHAIDPKVSQAFFTQEEDEALTCAVKHNDRQNWDVVADCVSSRRTAWQCFVRHRRGDLGFRGKVASRQRNPWLAWPPVSVESRSQASSSSSSVGQLAVHECAKYVAESASLDLIKRLAAMNPRAAEAEARTIGSKPRRTRIGNVETLSADIREAATSTGSKPKGQRPLRSAAAEPCAKTMTLHTTLGKTAVEPPHALDREGHLVSTKQPGKRSCASPSRRSRSRDDTAKHTAKADGAKQAAMKRKASKLPDKANEHVGIRLKARRVEVQQRPQHGGASGDPCKPQGCTSIDYCSWKVDPASALTRQPLYA